MNKTTIFIKFAILAASVTLMGCSSGFTELHRASFQGDLAKVKMLLNKGGNVNENNTGRFYNVNQKRYSSLFVDYTPVKFAIENGHQDVVDFLVSKGADLTTASGNGMRPLHIACSNGLLDIATMLVANGADVNIATMQGFTPLHYAAIALRNNVALMSLLIKNGAKMNPLGKSGYTTPLHYAAKYDSKTVAMFLLENGANVDAKDAAGKTPLHLAAWEGSFEYAYVLIKHQSNVNAVTTVAKETPLHLAATKGRTDVIKLLLKNGANINQKDERDVNAVDKALSKNRDSSVVFLKKHGGISNLVIEEESEDI